ncbi:MAG: hypothetical protein RLZZ182_193 [Pseudomonadota bacterium]|jgi:hypothetical protein
MSRRARSRLDKRATALELARFMGHGTPMPVSDEADDEHPPEDWDDTTVPDHRIPVGPLDVAAHPQL